MTRWTFVAVVLALGCGLGCGKSDPGPSCEKVTDHVFEITTKAFPGHESGMGNRKAYIEACESRKMSASERKCLLAAQDTLSLAKCRKIPEGARPSGKPPAPEPVKPADPAKPVEPPKPADPATPPETKPAAP
jgi:hypothetical protein